MQVMGAGAVQPYQTFATILYRPSPPTPASPAPNAANSSASATRYCCR